MLVLEGDMKKYWFKSKSFGYGFMPCGWEGWLATLLFLVGILGAAYLNGLFMPTIQNPNVLEYIGELIILIMLFSIIVSRKSTEKPRWNWGKKKNKNPPSKNN